MGAFDGGPFDFNGDGKTDLTEAGLGWMMLEEMQEEENGTPLPRYSPPRRSTSVLDIIMWALLIYSLLSAIAEIL